MKSIRILLTENCNANCKNCFNSGYRKGQNMNAAVYYKMIDYLSQNGIQKLKIMGGEPSVHPDFLDMLTYAQSKIEKVIVFTNAYNDKILDINVRENDSIVYNAKFLKNFSIEKLMLDKSGTRVFEVQIDSESNYDEFILIIESLLNKLERKWEKDFLISKIGFNLTLNCMENIFLNRCTLIENWNKTYNYLRNERGYDVKVDHSIPWCFFVNSNMMIKQGIWKCSSECSGLIDADFRLRYCNQKPDILLDFYDGKEFVSIKKVENYLKMGNMKKIYGNLEKICKDCPFFGQKCNGGCFMHKDFITAQDVFLNTDLPVSKSKEND